MNKIDQQRNQASMSMLEKMGAWIDKQIEDDEEQQRIEADWQSRRCTTLEQDNDNEDE